MSLKDLKPGKNAPNEVNVVIEIPMGGAPVKYELEKESGAIFVDRFMGTAMYYPANYGYVPATLSEDGDPVDVLVITPVPLMAGCVISARPIGMLNMKDEKGEDAKILAVPTDDLTSIYHNIKTYKDFPAAITDQISHFFEHYKDLETGKWVKISGWEGVDAAKQEIESSIKRYK